MALYRRNHQEAAPLSNVPSGLSADFGRGSAAIDGLCPSFGGVSTLQMQYAAFHNHAQVIQDSCNVRYSYVAALQWCGGRVVRYAPQGTALQRQQPRRGTQPQDQPQRAQLQCCARQRVRMREQSRQQAVSQRGWVAAP